MDVFDFIPPAKFDYVDLPVDCFSFVNKPTNPSHLLEIQARLKDALDEAVFGPKGNVWTYVYTSPATTSNYTAADLKQVAKLVEDMGPAPLNGMPVYTNRFMGEKKQTRFPRSKKRRIQRKWAKNPKYQTFVPDPSYYILAFDGPGSETIYGHPDTIARLLKAVNAKIRPTLRDTLEWSC